MVSPHFEPRTAQRRLYATLLMTLDASPRNRSIACDRNAIYRLLGLLPTLGDAPLVELNLKALELLGQHSISVRELKRLCALLRPEQVSRGGGGRKSTHTHTSQHVSSNHSRRLSIAAGRLSTAGSRRTRARASEHGRAQRRAGRSLLCLCAARQSVATAPTRRQRRGRALLAGVGSSLFCLLFSVRLETHTH